MLLVSPRHSSLDISLFLYISRFIFCIEYLDRKLDTSVPLDIYQSVSIVPHLVSCIFSLVSFLFFLSLLLCIILLYSANHCLQTDLPPTKYLSVFRIPLLYTRSPISPADLTNNFSRPKSVGLFLNYDHSAYRIQPRAP